MIAREMESIDEDVFVASNVPGGAPKGGGCSLCEGLFLDLDRYVEMVENKLSFYDLDTIVVGTRVPKRIEKRQGQLWENYGDRYARPIKSELNRIVGRRVQEDLGLEADFKRPDANPVLDLKNDRVELQVNSAFIYGQYNKYVRGLPQTVWHCNECGGRGCEECNYTGKKYQESVQEIIQEPFIDASRAKDVSFHGAGREDVDARCFARREFVLELKRPKNRNLELGRIKDELNESQDKVEVFKTNRTDKSRVKEVKTENSDKLYLAVIDLSERVKDLNLEELKEIPGMIGQRTPERVSHRRADRVRNRKVYWLRWEKLAESKLELILKTEAGTYVKELISGDEGRTKPSVAEKLSCEARCTRLDVLEIYRK